MKLSEVANSHDNNFNLIRFLAAFAVLISHSFVLVTGSSNNEPLVSTLNYSLGGIAVDVFFVTSGFLIAGSLMRRNDFASYFKARALRIYPALCVVVLLTVFVLGPLLTSSNLQDYFSNQSTWRYLYRNATVIPFSGHQILPGLFETNPYPAIVNGSLWTLAAELACYVGAAMLWFFCSRFFKVPIEAMTKLAAASCLALLASYYLSKLGLLPPKNAFRLYFFFFAGVNMYLLADHIKLDTTKAFLVFIAILTGCLNPGSFTFLYAPLMVYLTLYLAYVPGGALRKFNLLGDYSYGIYIYAFPVQQSLVYLIPDIGIAEMILTTSLITLTCAVLSWHLIEKMALSYK